MRLVHACDSFIFTEQDMLPVKEGILLH